MPAPRKAVCVCALASLLAIAATATAYVSEGLQDPSFGKDGLSTAAFGPYTSDEAAAAVVDTRGRTTVAVSVSDSVEEDFGLLRFLADGSLDPSFGTEGRARTLRSGVQRAHAMTIDSQGRIIVAGEGWATQAGDFVVARYLPDGKLDTSFADGGFAQTSFTDQDRGWAVAVDSQDRILVGGGIGITANSNYDFGVARYLPNGEVDESFGIDGLATTSFSSNGSLVADAIHSLAVDEFDRIVAGGTALNGASEDFALARFLPTGDLDMSFSGDGKLTTAPGSGEDGIEAVLIDDSGRIVAGGRGSGRFALARYLPSGTLDTSFSGDGIEITDMRSGDEAVRALALDSRGRIVANGTNTDDNWDSDWALARYLPDGTLDNSFSDDGKAFVRFGVSYDPESGPVFDYAYSVGVDGQDRVIGVGVTNAHPAEYSDVAIARLIGDSTTAIDSGPRDGSWVSTRSPVFHFSSSLQGATFECQFDSTTTWTPCTSPHALAPLAEGTHTFSVRAVTAETGPDATPASSTFIVDVTPPETTLGSITVKPRFVSVAFSSSEPGSVFQCSADDSKWFDCGPTREWIFEPGEHEFDVRAIDRAGNLDPTPADGGFTIPHVPGICVNRKTGTQRAEEIDGSRFGDRISAFWGNDYLKGKRGHDCLSGGPGRDTVLGGPGADRMDGDQHADRLNGGSGADIIEGDAGNDVVFARDYRRDVVRCGIGRDRVLADRRDRVARDCERVRRRRAAGGRIQGRPDR